MTNRVSFALGKGSHVSDGEAPTRVPVGAFQSVPIRELSRHLALDIPESFLWSSGIHKTVAKKVTPLLRFAPHLSCLISNSYLSCHCSCLTQSFAFFNDWVSTPLPLRILHPLPMQPSIERQHARKWTRPLRSSGSASSGAWPDTVVIGTHGAGQQVSTLSMVSWP